MKNRYIFPLCIQLSVPEDIYTDSEFASTLSLLNELDFYGVELNITDFDHTDPEKLNKFLAGFNLKLSMVATGGFANANGLSLSAADELVRTKSVKALEKMASIAGKCHAGVICGFIKGGPNQDKSTASAQLKKSLRDLDNREVFQRADVYLEATNHYEATLVNTVGEGTEYAKNVDGPLLVLPDSYHMNIEEFSTQAAMVRHTAYYRNFHVSDNNRYFPGLGSIDFFQILSLLKSLRYSGTIAIEGRTHGHLREDIRISADYLADVSSRIRRSF